jgi:gas vesicle protein
MEVAIIEIDKKLRPNLKKIIEDLLKEMPKEFTDVLNKKKIEFQTLSGYILTFDVNKLKSDGIDNIIQVSKEFLEDLKANKKDNIISALIHEFIHIYKGHGEFTSQQEYDKQERETNQLANKIYEEIKLKKKI